MTMQLQDEYIKAMKQLDNLFNYCEPIDCHIPEEERTGYDMLQDVSALRKFVSARRSDAIHALNGTELDYDEITEKDVLGNKICKVNGLKLYLSKENDCVWVYVNDLHLDSTKILEGHLENNIIHIIGMEE